MPRALLITIALLSVGCASTIRLAPVAPGTAADPASSEPPPPPVSQTLHSEVPPQNTPTPTATEDKSMGSPIVYTCPMHPEVRSDAPGTCPKCGMKLVPMKPARDPGSPR